MSRQGWIKTVAIMIIGAALLLFLAVQVVALLQNYSPKNVTMVEVPMTRNLDGRWSQDFHVMLPKNMYLIMFQFQPDDSDLFETPLRMSGEISVIASGGEVLLNTTFDKTFEPDDMERQRYFGSPNPAQVPPRQKDGKSLLPAPVTFFRPDLENGYFLAGGIGTDTVFSLPEHAMILTISARLRVEQADTAAPADMSPPLLRIGKFIDAV